jgi:glyoxylase-like metal-dependent hydrolase (beta-lactamase superfamily II)
MIITFKMLQAGYCTQYEKFAIRGGALRKISFPALFGLIDHSQYGYILFDTGYSDRFYRETSTFPNLVYPKLTPVRLEPDQSAVVQLQQMGIAASAIKLIIISHFHPDHIGGLRDFPEARFIYNSFNYQNLKRKKRIAALANGFFPGLLPDNFEARSRDVENCSIISLSEQYAPFDRAYDMLGDGSLLLVELPGHAEGQLGLFLSTNRDRYFLISDACWLKQSFQTFTPPNGFVRLITHHWGDYLKTLKKISHLHQRCPEMKIIPSHQDLSSL